MTGKRVIGQVLEVVNRVGCVACDLLRLIEHFLQHLWRFLEVGRQAGRERHDDVAQLDCSEELGGRKPAEEIGWIEPAGGKGADRQPGAAAAVAVDAACCAAHCPALSRETDDQRVRVGKASGLVDIAFRSEGQSQCIVCIICVLLQNHFARVGGRVEPIREVSRIKIEFPRVVVAGDSFDGRGDDPGIINCRKEKRKIIMIEVERRRSFTIFAYDQHRSGSEVSCVLQHQIELVRCISFNRE